MEAASTASSLFSEFEPVPADAWKARILADLKGADFEKALTRTSYEGITTQPFYSAEVLTNNSAGPDLGNLLYTGGKNGSGSQWLNAPLIST
ncbi:MAG: hypothetical protein EOO03_08545, partial [Chitinophagaceae bacterium]